MSKLDEMTENGLIKEFKIGLGITYKIFNNRIEYSTGGGIFKKQVIILVRNIASINKPSMLNRVDIKTNDGKIYKFAPSANPKTVEEFVQIVLGLI